MASTFSDPSDPISCSSSGVKIWKRRPALYFSPFNRRRSTSFFCTLRAFNSFDGFPSQNREKSMVCIELFPRRFTFETFSNFTTFPIPRPSTDTHESTSENRHMEGSYCGAPSCISSLNSPIFALAADSARTLASASRLRAAALSARASLPSRAWSLGFSIHGSADQGSKRSAIVSTIAAPFPRAQRFVLRRAIAVWAAQRTFSARLGATRESNCAVCTSMYSSSKAGLKATSSSGASFMTTIKAANRDECPGVCPAPFSSARSIEIAAALSSGKEKTSVLSI